MTGNTTLWDDIDLAAYLKIGTSEIEAAGLPDHCVVWVGANRRWRPDSVCAWASLGGCDPSTVAQFAPRTVKRPRSGSGAPVRP